MRKLIVLTILLVFVPLSAAQSITQDNYTSDEWQNEAQLIQIECTTGVNDCWDIDWRILRDDTVLRSDPDNNRQTSVAVEVGSQYEGFLILEYRGETPSGGANEWKAQSVKVDKTPPETQITAPDPDVWYEDDITVGSEDDRVNSQSGVVELKYLLDTSTSLEEGVWQQVLGSADQIESDVEDDLDVDLEYSIIANNNSYRDNAPADDIAYHCDSDQISPYPTIGPYDGEVECAYTWDEVDRVSDTKSYVDWLNENQGTSFTVSTFDARDRKEPPSEGWGMSILDIIEKDPWLGGTDRIVVPVTDQDANGGDPGPSCGDAVAQDLTQDLVGLTDQYGIDVIGLVSEQECENNAAVDQLNTLGDAIEYQNRAEFETFVKNNIDGSIEGTCEYRLREEGGEWSDWQERSCPNGGFEVTIGEEGSGEDCTVPGQDKCIVQIRAIDKAGNVAYDTASFNIALLKGSNPDFDMNINFPDDTENSYTSFITTSEHPDIMPVQIKNSGGLAQRFVTRVEGNDIQFQTGGQQSEEYMLNPGETKTLLIQVGTTRGKQDVNLVTESRTLGITKTETIEVLVRDHRVRTNREIPGIEGLQIAALTLASTVVYSVLL